MELVISAISAGGLVGASDQYLCLLLISVASKLGLIGLAPQVDFMASWWFLGIIALFWVITVLPAFASALSPGVMNAVNTAASFISGFLVPVSAGLLTLVSVGIIADAHPDLTDILRTLQIFSGTDAGVGTVGWLMAGSSALVAGTITGAKFLAKPALSTATGTVGTASAPLYAAIENAASIILMGLGYLLSQINPWLIVALLALVLIGVLVIFGWAIYQLWRLGKGIGRVIHLIEARPKAGLSIVAEFLVWGSGWLIWKRWPRGVVRIILWLGWLALMVFAIPALGTALAVALAVVPVLEFLVAAFVVGLEITVGALGIYLGIVSARGLMRTFEETESTASSTHRQPAPAA